MTQVQKVLLDLLVEMDEICQKHGIKYYLGGGTALGAIRNKGFLPWDNDMDIYMSRAEFNKLLSVIDSEIRTDRFLTCTERNPYYMNPIARYGNKNTTKLYFSLITDGESCGQHFDILIFDPTPNDEKERKEFIEKMQIYCEILQPYFAVHRNTFKSNHKFNYKLYDAYLKRVEKEGKQTILDELESYFSSIPDEESELYCMRWGLGVLLYNRAYFGEPRRVDFENLQLPVGQFAERIFRLAYGDNWMLMPPRSQRLEKPATDNADVPSDKLVKLYHKGYDKNQAVADFTAYKNGVLYFRILRERYDRIRYEKMFREDIRKIKNIDALSFLDVQTSIYAMKYEFAYDAPVNIVVEAFTKLLSAGDFALVFEILKIRRINEIPENEELVEIESMAKHMRRMSEAYYDLKDYSLIEEELKKNVNHSIPFLAAFENIITLRRENESELKKLYDVVKDKINNKNYYDDDLFLKTTADVFLFVGDEKTACSCYSVVFARTLNTMLIQEIEILQTSYPLIQKHLGFTEELINDIYKQSLVQVVNKKKSKKTIRDKINLNKIRIGYAIFLLKQDKDSSFGFSKTKEMYRTLKTHRKIIDGHKRNFTKLKKVAADLG